MYDEGLGREERAAASPLRVFVAVPQALVRAGVRATLEAAPGLRVVGIAATGAEASRRCAVLRPDVALLGLRLTGPTALETATMVRRACPATRIVALAPPGAIDAVRAMIVLGAAGVVGLDDPPEAIVRALEAAGRGHPWYDAALLATLVTEGPAHDATTLTRREREVLALVATGRRNREIAAVLNVSERTVEFHLSHLFAKLGARSRTEAVRRASERSLLGAPPPDGTPR